MIGVGETIGNYQITAKLGEGGMGIVYLAEHPVIGKKVAMKAIHPELARNAEVVSRFMTEAKAVNQIGNEHIVDISDFGTTPEGEFYFVMEFLQGESLADRLKRERLPPARAQQIAVQVADALGASHEHGIIHRDLKPENIYLIQRGSNRDFVKVLDFGLAKLTQGYDKVSHKTRTGSVMGTPYYMAPEQCEGKANIDQRADIYSLGIILFEMLTGRVPFGGEGYGEIIVKHITMAPPPMSSFNPTVPPSLESIVARALMKDREQRFQSMAELGQALMDPDGYAAGAPRVPIVHPEEGGYGAMPVMRADAGGSGAIGYGSGLNLGEGTRSTPSTFRGGAGEVVDDLREMQGGKRRATMIAAAVVLVAALGGGALVLKSRLKGDARRTTPAVANVVKASHPATVRINFASDPTGALVIRSETGVAVGMTPLSAELPYGETPISFIFKKEGYAQKEMSLIPNLAAQLLADMEKVVPQAVVPQPPSTQPEATAEEHHQAETKPARVRQNGGTHRVRRPARTGFDEDAVLEPSFR